MTAVSSATFKESVLRKCRESAEMKARFFEANAGVLKKFAAAWRRLSKRAIACS